MTSSDNQNDLTNDLTPDKLDNQSYTNEPSQQEFLMQPHISSLPNQYATYMNPIVPIQVATAPEFAVHVPNPPNATAATSNTSLPKTLWMGDLDPWSDEESIMNLWSLTGKHVLVKLIKAKRGTPAASLNTGHAGYCFIEFDTFEDAKEALTLNGTPIANTNRVFRLNWASGATLDSTIPQTAEYSLFVGDLTPTTTEAHLLALFQSQFNSVKTVRVMTDPITGTSRCFGFVRFSDEEERTRALNTMNGMWCLGRPLRVALAAPKSQALNLMQHNVQIPNYGINPAYGNPGPIFHQGLPLNPQLNFVPKLDQYGGIESPDFAMQQMSQEFQLMNLSPNTQQYQQQHTDPKNCTVFIGGLAPGIMEPTLAQVFRPFGKIMHVKIPPGKGCGFIRFEKREEAENAIAGMQGFQIGGARVRLSWGRQQNNNQKRGYFNGLRTSNLPQPMETSANYQYNSNMGRSGMIPNVGSAGFMVPEYFIETQMIEQQPEFSNSSYNSSYETPDSVAEPETVTTTSDFRGEVETSSKQGESKDQISKESEKSIDDKKVNLSEKETNPSRDTSENKNRKETVVETS